MLRGDCYLKKEITSCHIWPHYNTVLTARIDGRGGSGRPRPSVVRRHQRMDWQPALHVHQASPGLCDLEKCGEADPRMALNSRNDNNNNNYKSPLKIHFLLLNLVSIICSLNGEPCLFISQRSINKSQISMHKSRLYLEKKSSI